MSRPADAPPAPEAPPSVRTEGRAAPDPRRGEDHRVAFIDMGTNSLRLLVASVTDDGRYRVLSRQKETVRLGEGVFATGRLAPDAMDRAVTVCREFRTMIRALGVSRVIAVATAASREAENRRPFLARIRREAELEFRVIPGVEEARLVWLGVASGLRLDDRRAVFIDIGGGSTEIILGTQSEHAYLDSLELGAIRLTNRFFAPGEEAPVSDERYAEICDHVRNRASRTIREIRHRHDGLAVGSSGTINKIADVAAHLCRGEASGRDGAVSRAEVRAAVTHLRSLPLSKRRRIRGMNPARADIIVAGAAILDTLMSELGLEHLRSSDRGLREGLLLEHLSRSRSGVGPWDPGSMRERSVLALARSCRFEEGHARHVAHLADRLFVESARLGLHDLGATARGLLRDAALLHDIGVCLSYDGHHLHSHYLIRHADLLGFDETDIEIIAATARFHQKAFPVAKHPDVRRLDEASRPVVVVLSMLLRLAECLDRSHGGVVTDVRLARVQGEEPGTGARIRLEVEVEPGADWHLENWATAGQAERFEAAFGVPLEVPRTAAPAPIGR